jgi:tetratricopeptide (TPR) repeat protein
MNLAKATLLLALLCCFAGPASATWFQARSRHFIVYSEGSPEAVRRAATDLERFDQALRALIQLPDINGDDPNPVTVFVVDGMNAIRTLCTGGNAKATKDCQYVAGFYSSRVSGSVAFAPRRAGTGQFDISAQAILFHGYANHLMMANFGAAYPAWYRVGFAEFVSNVKLDKEGEVGLGLPANGRISSHYLLAAIPMRRLLTVDSSSLSPDERLAFDARAWLAMHYLAFSSKRHGQTNAYLKAISTGASAAAAAAAAFGDLHELDKELGGYLRRGRFTYLRIGVPPIPEGAVKVIQLTAGDAAMMPVRIWSNRGVNDSAKDAVPLARAIASTYPNDPQAQGVLAQAEFDAGNLDAADAAADRVLSNAPGDMMAMVYKAQVLLHRENNGAPSGGNMWKEARRWLSKANKVQPDAAWPLYLFFTSYRMQGQKPKQNAVDALERAFVLAPQDNSVRMSLVQHYIEEKNFRGARVVLEPIAFNPHIAADHPATRLLAQIDEWEKNGKAATSTPAMVETK